MPDGWFKGRRGDGGGGGDGDGGGGGDDGDSGGGGGGDIRGVCGGREEKRIERKNE